MVCHLDDALSSSIYMHIPIPFLNRVARASLLSAAHGRGTLSLWLVLSKESSIFGTDRCSPFAPSSIYSSTLSLQPSAKVCSTSSPTLLRGHHTLRLNALGNPANMIPNTAQIIVVCQLQPRRKAAKMSTYGCVHKHVAAHSGNYWSSSAQNTIII